MMMLFRREPVEVLQADSNTSRIVVGDYEPFWVPNSQLKPLPTPKKTDVQQALEADPTALNEFVEVFKRGGRIEISCQPSKVPQLSSELSSISSLTELNATDFIHPTTERSHHAKFDILIKNPPSHLVDRLGVFFDFGGHRTHKDEAQINSRPLAEWLMKNHDVLPTRRNPLREEYV